MITVDLSRDRPQSARPASSRRASAAAAYGRYVPDSTLAIEADPTVTEHTRSSSDYWALVDHVLVHDPVVRDHLYGPGAELA